MNYSDSDSCSEAIVRSREGSNDVTNIVVFHTCSNSSGDVVLPGRSDSPQPSLSTREELFADNYCCTVFQSSEFEVELETVILLLF